jgi:hypothetical protein
MLKILYKASSDEYNPFSNQFKAAKIDEKEIESIG